MAPHRTALRLPTFSHSPAHPHPPAPQVVEHWTFSLFFCSAELWGSVVISVLFWSLANEVCSVEEARAVYPLMGVAANVALVLAGGFVKVVNAHVPAGATLGLLVAAVVGMTGAMLLAKAAIDRRAWSAVMCMVCVLCRAVWWA